VTPPRWSVVIPAFNEARRLPAFLDTVIACLEGRDEPYEVIVVDDGSTDGTSAIVETPRLAMVRVLSFQRNAGKGAAVRAGMLAARGAYRLFADADGATPIAELKRLESALMAGADVAIGSRALRDPGVSVAARRHRVAAGFVFNRLVGWMGLEAVRLQGVHGGGRRSPVPGARHARLRFRRRAASPGPGRRLSYRRGAGELGRSAR